MCSQHCVLRCPCAACALCPCAACALCPCAACAHSTVLTALCAACALYPCAACALCRCAACAACVLPVCCLCSSTHTHTHAHTHTHTHTCAHTHTRTHMRTRTPVSPPFCCSGKSVPPLCYKKCDLPTVIANGTKERMPSLRPEKTWEKAKTIVRVSYDAILHRGMLIAMSLLHDLGSALGLFCTKLYLTKLSVFANLVTWYFATKVYFHVP